MSAMAKKLDQMMQVLTDEDYLAASRKSCAADIHKRIHCAYQRNFGCKLYRRNRPYKDRRYDQKRDLQRMDSTFDMRGGLPLPYARADKAFRHF